MSTPAPVRIIEYFSENFRYPVVTVGCVVCLPLLALYTASGVIFPDYVNPIGERPKEVIGLFLLFSILPAYLLMCFAGLMKSSDLLFASLESQVSNREAQSFSRFQYTRHWPLAVIWGILFALWPNINWEYLDFEWGNPQFRPSIFIVFGQISTWIVVSLVLFFVLHEGFILSKYGKHLKVDLYDLDSLNGFGRAGLNGLLLAVGALVLTTLQSLDLVVRWDIYSKAVYFGVPAAILLVLLPIWSVHKNIVQEKAKALDSINRAIKSASDSLDSESLTRLNGLLIRREQLHHMRNWPMDLSIFSRLVFYIFIPPLAWAGAALTEVLLDSYLGS